MSDTIHDHREIEDVLRRVRRDVTASHSDDYNERAAASASLNAYLIPRLGNVLDTHLRRQHDGDVPNDPWAYAYELDAHHEALHGAPAHDFVKEAS